jgi:glycosyltransferase involved in cell wall biosynthesis
MSRICIFSRAFYPAIGGLETMAKLLATQGIAFGHEIEVVTDSPALSREDDKRQPFRVTRTRATAGRVKAFRRADAALFMNVSLHGLLAARLTGVRVVLSHHGIYGARGVPQRYLEALKRGSTRRNVNICASAFVAAHIPGESVVVHNAYDNCVFRWSANSRRDRDFVFCGRLVTEKGADLCLRALAAARKQEPGIVLTIIGGGSERLLLQYLARELKAAEAVTFLGALTGDALAAALKRHACLVAPSLLHEAFGIVALEGIACCDTVIVTRRGGLPEAVGDCGIVVEPSEAALAEAMVSVARARRLGHPLPGQPTDQQREAHLAAHSPAIVARQYFDVIERVIASTGGHGRT